jgi:hypothetical protein
MTETVKTQGTAVYFIDDTAVAKLAAPTGVSGLGGATDQIETTDLDALEDKTYVAGLGSPGQVSVPFNFKPGEASQQTLFDLKISKAVIGWMVCLSDGTAAPTITSGALVAPAARTSIGFQAFVSDVVVDVATNEIVRGTLTLQRSGPLAITWKT